MGEILAASLPDPGLIQASGGPVVRVPVQARAQRSTYGRVIRQVVGGTVRSGGSASTVRKP
jgi:hypothetical protein